MNYDNIPEEMKVLPQWVCYRLKWNETENKYKKVIISPRNGKFATCNNPDTWTDYESAKEYSGKYKFDGCFILKKLDKCYGTKYLRMMLNWVQDKAGGTPSLILSRGV